MNTIIASFLNSKIVKGILTIQAFLQGKKTYIVAFGAAATAGVNLIQQFSSLPNTVSIVEWARHLTGNQDAVVFWHSLLVMTLRAGVSKVVATPAVVSNGKDATAQGNG